jgi:hypothetical protein
VSRHDVLVETTSYACPVCGTVHQHQSERYRNHLCFACADRARCVAHDRQVVGFNTSLSGGFVAFHDGRQDDTCEQVTGEGTVTVDGAEFVMREARFGGIVVHPVVDPSWS